MGRELALPANPILLWTPTTEHNVSLQRLPHRTEPSALSEPLAMVPIATVALHRVLRVLDRHRTIASSVLPARTSSTGPALALMEMAFAPVLV